MEIRSDNGHETSYPESDSEGDNWSSVLTDKQYVCFEDPFSGATVPKKEFHSMYGPACREIFQCCITLEVLFAANPVMIGEWRFVDEDARQDLIDAAVDLKLVPSFDEICAGETEKQKAARQQKEREGRALEKSREGKFRPPQPLARKQERIAEEKKLKTKAELESELIKVLAAFESSAMSNKQRKKLERRRWGIMAALEKSDEGVDA